MMRFNHNRTTAATRVLALVAVVVALLCFSITANACNFEWNTIQTGQSVNGEYTPFVALGELNQNAIYKLELIPTGGEIIVDVDTAVDYGSIWAMSDDGVNYEPFIFEGVPSQIYDSISDACEPVISTPYSINSANLRFMYADFTLYEQVEVRQQSVLGGLITTMFSAFSETIGGLADGVKDMFMNLLYEDPTASVLVLSDFAKFGFLMMGLSMALGLGYFIIRKIRG